MLLYVYVYLLLALSSALVSRWTRPSSHRQIGSVQRDLLQATTRKQLLQDDPEEDPKENPMPQKPYDPFSSPVISEDDGVAIPTSPDGTDQNSDPLSGTPGDGTNSPANIPLQPTTATANIPIDPFIPLDASGNWHKSGSSQVAPEVQELTAQFYQTSRRVKIRYGPFKVKAASDLSFEKFLNANGGVFDFVKPTAKRPCKECIITYAAAGLEYADGSEANTDSGVWLRGLSVVNNMHTDLTCTLWRQRIFESGNERMPVLFSDIKNPYMRTGYHVGSKDTFGVQSQILNMNSSPRTVYITVIWEYIPSQPAGWRKTRAVFLDLTKCNLYPGVPMKADSKAIYTFGPWKSTIQGKILSATGHISDGGLNVVMTKNGRQFCSSFASYGTRPGYYGPSSPSGNLQSHVSSMDVCTLYEQLNVGDSLAIEVNYDIIQHQPILSSNGKKLKAEGTGMLFVTVD